MALNECSLHNAQVWLTQLQPGGLGCRATDPYAPVQGQKGLFPRALPVLFTFLGSYFQPNSRLLLPLAV